MIFEKYPFEKLSNLLEGLVGNKAYTASILTIGEPQFKTPQFIQDVLKDSSELLNKYPKSAGEPYLKEAMINFNKKRFNVELQLNQIIPVLGTKEVLFNFPQFYLSSKNNPTMAFTNPFYKIYEGAAIASRAKIIHLDLLEENNFLPLMNDEELKQCDLVILNFPNNPTCAMMSQEILEKWVKKALEFDFVLINDECYSEIYFDENKKPVSLLEASISAGNKDFKNVLVLNSISKRSSAPGLRDGFIAGDKDILKGYALYRTYSGCVIPLPLQKASAAAWNDEHHVQEFRDKYKENFKLVKEILDIDMPEATFYVWLKVKDDLRFTKELFVQKNIKVLPGTYLSSNDIGKNYIRIALVEDAIKTREVLTRLKEFMESYK